MITKLSPGRQALAAAHAQLAALQQRHEEIQDQIGEQQAVVDGQQEAEGALDGITALERLEMNNWVNAGDGTPEPKPHTRERAKAQQALRVASARADSARAKLAELKSNINALKSQFERVSVQIREAVRAVLVEELTRVAIQYRRAAAMAATLKAQLDAFTRAVPGQFQVENFGSLSAEIGMLMESQPVGADAAVIADRDAWMRWLNALDGDAGAELPGPAAVELETARPVHAAAPRFEPRGPIPVHPGVMLHHHQ